jgi:nucleotide-binding universal stress UspA family protein
LQSDPHIVVVGMDFSELSDEAFRRAYELAALHPASELHAIRVTEPAKTAPLADYDAIEPTTPLQLDELSAVLAKHVDRLLVKMEGSFRSDVRVVSHSRIDAPMLGITQLASELKAQLIVVGTHGRHGLARWLLGSVAEGVVRHAACPVLIIPPHPPLTDLVQIEPLCSHCAEARRATDGRELWCTQHRDRHGRRHTYHQRDRMSEDSSFPLVAR